MSTEKTFWHAFKINRGVKTPIWKRLRVPDQNLAADIALAQSELEKIKPLRLDNEQRQVLQTCEVLLQACIDAHSGWTKNRVFVRQTLFLITQNLILIFPSNRLNAAWLSLQQRRAAVGEAGSEDAATKNAVKILDAYFAEKDSLRRQQTKKPEASKEEVKEDEKRIRQLIRQIKFAVDDRVVGDYLSSVVLQRQTYLLGTIALAALLAVIAILIGENCGSSGIFTCGVDDHSSHGLAATVLAGVLGGALSTIASPSIATGPSVPLVRVAFIRPLIGGIAGFFLFLTSVLPNAVIFKYPYLYAAAVAIGFSERAFKGALESSANKIGAEVSRAIGHASKRSGK